MTENLNFSSTKTSGLVENLKPSTHYNCYVYTANSAGLGRRSKVRTILTRECQLSLLNKSAF